MSDTLASKILSAPTKRDQQVEIGPSTIGSPCDVCVAEALLATAPPTERQRYWAGAAIGTAVHERIEKRIPEVFPIMLPEQKIVVGELDGYGVIDGTADGLIPPNEGDLYPTDVWVCVDWKTTDREKLRWIKQAFLYEPTENESKPLAAARFKVESYFGQTSVYARGMRNAGVPVEKILVSFICRDAKTEADFFEVEIDYDDDYANEVWSRLEYIWENLYAVEWQADPRCYTHGDRRY